MEAKYAMGRAPATATRAGSVRRWILCNGTSGGTRLQEHLLPLAGNRPYFCRLSNVPLRTQLNRVLLGTL